MQAPQKHGSLFTMSVLFTMFCLKPKKKVFHQYVQEGWKEA